MTGERGDEPASGPIENVSFDELFDALSHHRRRYIVVCLDRYGSPMTLPDVADECAVMEHQRALDDIPARTVSRMYMTLYHTHVPKLAGINAVEYDQESDSVAIGETAAHLMEHVTLSRTRLSTSAKRALSTLRTQASNGQLPTTQARKLLGDEETRPADQLRHLEGTGYIAIRDGTVALVEW